MTIKRESNFELMRIISMLMIITGHVFSWGGIFSNSSPNITKYIYLIYAIIFVHVNSFILLTGYFQSTSKFKFKKLIKLLLLMYFYKVLITILGYNLGWFTLSKTDLLWQISPFDFSNYWFILLYIILYLLSPFLNRFISKLNKNTFKKVLIVLFIMVSLVETLTAQEFFPNTNGYSLVQFVFMYLIGAYIRKYVINSEIKEELYKKKNKKYLVAAIFISISIYILCFILNYSIFRVGSYMTGKSYFLTFIGKRITSVFINYDNPLIILGSIGYFLFFSLIKFKNKFINILSSTVMEIYIIHETHIFRNTLYSWFGLNTLKYVTSYNIFLKVFIIVLSIFFGCVLIEYVRRLIFKILKFLIDKLKIFNKIKNKINNIENKVDAWINI